jgi:hypothetical protein
LEKLVEELKLGAQHHGFSGEVWTCQRVNSVIEKLFGVSYDPTQVGRILRKLGWSLQKPSNKARQQSAQKVSRWREEVLPALKKAEDENRVILYIDEAACYLLPLLSRCLGSSGADAGHRREGGQRPP